MSHHNICSIQEMCAHAIRFLTVDAVYVAGSGHPGMPLGMADLASVLWREFLRHDPQHPDWIDRDRFVLSNGHGSMLLYAVLHLTGYDVSIEDVKNFRHLGSKTPGHPEWGVTPGVDTTTGPLGQGLAHALGMAIAESALAARYNTPEFPVINHHTYVFLGDGCLMEGVSHEAASLAGSLRLGKLIAFWDDNKISIDGPVASWCSDDTAKRFLSYGWHVIPQIDGHDPQSVRLAIQEAQAIADQPTLLCCQTKIGFGLPNEGDASCHGTPPSAHAIHDMRQKLNWNHPAFEIPEQVSVAWKTKKDDYSQWKKIWTDYSTQYPEQAHELKRVVSGILPKNFLQHTEECMRHMQTHQKMMSTRHASRCCLNLLAPLCPELFGGSADLTESNGTQWDGARVFSHTDRLGSYMHYGVRELGMSAVMNGMAVHGGLLPFGGTFLVFSDYARPAVRLAALMKQAVVFIYTHDSIAVGEDGPTHQPIEQAASLRLIPHLAVWRPADAVETAAAWRDAFQRYATRQGPTAVLLTRQNVPTLSRSESMLHAMTDGAYVIHEGGPHTQAVVIATGSEVQLAIQVAELLALEGCMLRVVSMPCCETFRASDRAHQESVLLPQLPFIVIEAGASVYWHSFSSCLVIGLEDFGVSGSGPEVYAHFGFNVSSIAERIRGFLQTQTKEPHSTSTVCPLNCTELSHFV